MTDISRWAGPGLLDQGSSRTRIPMLRNGKSVALAGAAVLGISGTLFFGFGYLRYERLINAEHAAAAHAEIANANLQDALAKLRDQLAAADRSMGDAQDRINALSDEARRQTEQAANGKADRITQLTRALEQAQRELHLTEAQRATLMARLSKAEVDQQQQVQAGAEQWQKKVQQLSTDRDKAAAERDQLRSRIEELQQKLSQKQAQQAARAMAQATPVQPAPMHPAPAAPGPVVAAVAPPPVAAVAPAPVAPAPVAQTPVAQAPAVQPQPALAYAAPAPAPAPLVAPVQAQAAPVAAPAQVAVVAPAVPPAVQQIAVVRPESPRPVMATTAPATAADSGRLAQFERVLASAGVDVTHLFAQYGVNRGEGGPFIPAAAGAHMTQLSPDKLAALGGLVKVLPVTAPLESYTIGSGFGGRGDPINGRASFHTGLDFDAPYDSPVFATAPGVVTFAGYRDDYGRIVEIDHGHGIMTRYGHLHQALVSVGQRVAFHTQIGWLGSSGRATGPHVHYEVLVNGEPQDPAKFLGLGRLVQVSAQR